jgi:hypothetical protein
MSIVHHALGQLDGPDTSALIVHGSHAHGAADQLSDLDIIRVQYQEGLVQRFYDWNGVKVDLYGNTSAAILSNLSKPARFNNHFLINSLTDCLVWLDRSGEAALLVAKAKELRELGPVAMTEKDRAYIVFSLRRLEDSVSHLVARPQHKPFAEMRTGDLFKYSVYFYMMVTRRWSASLRDTVAALRVSGDPLSGPLDTFLSEPDVAKRLPILHGIIETVCSTKLVGGGREGKPNLQGFM